MPNVSYTRPLGGILEKKDYGSIWICITYYEMVGIFCWFTDYCEFDFCEECISNATKDFTESFNRYRCLCDSIFTNWKNLMSL